DVATFEGINSALSARYFQAGHNNLGIVDDGVGISPMKYTKGLIPNEIIAELAYLQSLANEGQINIPQNESELGSFDASSIVFPF
ncbi:MAG: BMP family ABC transporter substrate-binding protein, partial [Thermotogota bacterium]|nr:BMP family ABC transporter substrate-binding protein [Thermotogota bacterium]